MTLRVFAPTPTAQPHGALTGLLCYILGMRILPCLLLLPALSFAQVPHTFNNGEGADAEKINENFNYVLQNASGGCSATQQENSVVIECADGTSGVVASYGTVVVLPSGSIKGVLPDITSVPVGDIYVVDATDIALGRVVPSR